METYEISDAEPSDAEILSEISFKSKKYWGYPEEWMNIWRVDLMVTEELINQNDVYKITVRDQIIGFTIISSQDDLYEVEHCWILPEYIGKGYGSHLLSNVLSRVPYLQKRFKVVADPHAIAFYEKFGFELTGNKASQPAGRSLPILHMTNA